MWVPFAVGFAFFAGVTAVLAKCGIRTTDSTAATAIRAITRTPRPGPGGTVSAFRSI